MKILSAWATVENRNGRLHELATLEIVARTKPPTSHLPRLLDHFEISGPHGEHLCFVLDAQSTSIETFRRSLPNKVLRPHVVQIIIIRVLNALAELHANNIVHTGEISLPAVSSVMKVLLNGLPSI